MQHNWNYAAAVILYLLFVGTSVLGHHTAIDNNALEIKSL